MGGVGNRYQNWDKTGSMVAHVKKSMRSKQLIKWSSSQEGVGRRGGARNDQSSGHRWQRQQAAGDVSMHHIG
eukprot:10112936-Karenia_brevis.AAC.1